MRKLARTVMIVAALGACLGLALAVPAGAGKGMRTTKLGNKLCKTSGGGKFVGIPGFPGERIDRRLIADIRWMKRRWDIFVTDGYSGDPVHSANGEHPLGLALDIVPNKAAGGTWKKIDRLAAWAEPSQNRPRSPFRWVGYDGDAGHGRGHHLHLSWSHSEARAFRPARTVWTVNCPGSGTGKRDGGGNGNDGGKGDKSKGDKGAGGGGVPAGGGAGNGDKGKDKGGNGAGKGEGGVNPGRGGGNGGSGGVGLRKAERRLERQQGAASSVETGGIGLG